MVGGILDFGGDFPNLAAGLFVVLDSGSSMDASIIIGLEDTAPI